MDLQIQGKKAIMAGGSAGIGRATAERLAEAGVTLYITEPLCSTLSRFIVGQNIVIDGGQHHSLF
jgi:short-subunit dehydrogenase involved in D-alanine esterification of teichoic acids